MHFAAFSGKLCGITTWCMFMACLKGMSTQLKVYEYIYNLQNVNWRHSSL